MKQLRFRSRLLLILSLFAVVPAAVLTITWSGMFSTALPFVSGRSAWERAAATGQRAITEVRRAPLSSAQRALLEAHERELSASLEQARRLEFLAGRSVRVIALSAVVALALLGLAASRVAGHLSRQLSRPLDELVRWTDLLAQGRQLPPPEQTAPRGAPEFRTLRGRMREMAAALEQARARSAEAERLKAYRESARRVAHELKNPLTPIRFAVQRLKRDAPPEVADAVDVLETESARLERIARSFASFGRLPEGTPSLIDVGELVRYAAGSTLPPGTRVTVSVEDGIPCIMAHHDSLAGAVSNVLLNAADAAGAGGSIDVHVRRVSAPRESVEIAVLDDGPGMDAETLQNIWQPYTTSKPGGTGLGLAIARQAVLAHDGNVSASSTPGGGTEIRFTLPVTREPLQETPASAAWQSS